MSNKGLLNITDYLYDILNDKTLTDEITGNIFKNKAPINRGDVEDVIIIGNFINPKKISQVQSGLHNVNLEMPANSDGTVKHTRMKKLADIIRTLLEENNENHTLGFYFDIEQETIFDEMYQNQKQYYNFRINVKKQ